VDDLLRIAGVLALVGANAYFVVGEYSVVTARRARIATLAEEGRRGAGAALRLMDDPVRVISTVQVGITAVGILTGAIGEPLVREVLGDGIPDWAGFVIAFLLVTYLSVVFGELVPKAVTLDRAERIAVVVAPSVGVLARVLRPIVWVLERSAEVLLRPLGIKEVVAGEAVASAEELRALVDEAEGAGVIPRAQEEILHNVFDFARLEARDVMAHASDIQWLDAGLPVGDAAVQAAAGGHTRYPVGGGSLDRVEGVVHLAELVTAAAVDASQPTASVARPVIVVPPTKDVGALLRELREANQQIAIVADEYGRTLGLVTIEDILEELVGEIQDEFDLPDDRMTELADGSVRIAGSMTVDDFNETLGTSLPVERAHTIAGLIFDALARRPQVGDSVSIAQVRMTVEALDGARITSVVARRTGS
jgi:putative hemolysin